MTVVTSAGTTLSLSATAPSTLDEAGYSAVIYTAVGEVSDLGDVPAQVYDLVTWRNVYARGEVKVKGGFTLPPQTITVGYDPKDAGQALLATATSQDALYTVCIAHPQLGEIYGRALVMGGKPNLGDVNAIATRPVTLEYVDAVFVPYRDVPPNALIFSDGTPLQFSDGSYLELIA